MNLTKWFYGFCFLSIPIKFMVCNYIFFLNKYLALQIGVRIVHTCYCTVPH